MADELTIRAAELVDARFYWEVNNHPSVRAQSINTNPIAWDMHEAWFAASLQNPSRRLYVATVGEESVGVVRFDIHDGLATISVALSPDCRGRGLGSRTIARGCDTVVVEVGAQVVEALIRPDNTASLIAFERAGFEIAERGVQRNGVELDLMTWKPTQ